METPTLSVVIATRNRPQLLAATLESLAQADSPPVEVVIVDGDPGESARAVTEAAAANGGLNVRYLTGPPGLTRQRNAALGEVHGDVVVFLDDDVSVGRNVLTTLADAFRDPEVAGATVRIEEDAVRRFGAKESRVRRFLVAGREGSMTSFGYPRRLTRVDRARDVEFMPGCLMAARLDLARELGFDEQLEPPGGYALAEDEDFTYRLSRRGRLRYLPEAVIQHHNTGMRSMDAREFNRLVVVNRAYLLRKNFPRTVASRIGFAALLAMLAVHRALNREWAGVRGLVDGAREAWRSAS